MPTRIGRRFRRVLVAAVTAGVASGVGAAAPATAPAVDWSSATAATSFVDGHVLVGFQPGTGVSALLNQISANLGLSELRQIGTTHVLSVPGGQVLAKISQLQQIPGISFAEPDYTIHADAIPNDPNFGNQWAWRNTGQNVNGTSGTSGADIHATGAWDVTKGSNNVVVAVQDTGFNYNHPDLQANAWSSNVSVTENGVTCGSGTHGYRQINGVSSCDPLDDEDHGSHVSGTIGAVGNNGTGVTGENWSVKIMGLKFLDSTGSGSTSDALACMDFAIKAKQAGVNLVAMNASWGNGTTQEQSMINEINALGNAGILFIAAAGNNGSSSPEYPAGYGLANEISVAASDQNDNLASFSDRGSTVDLAAPGTNVLSTVRSGYAYFQGTSMATPHVTGAAALIAASGVSGASAIRSAIVNNVDVISGLTNKVKSNGRLDVCKAISGCNNPPPPPPPPPPTCGVVTNCGFENGMTGWTAGGQSPNPTSTTTQSHSGSASALVGASSAPEPNGDTWMYQTVTVPSSSPTLSFWYKPFTSDTITYDWQEVQIRNSSGGFLTSVMKIDSNTQTWTNVTFNMSAYAGQSVQLWFNSHQDGYGDLTYMYVDDVGLSGAGPTTPGAPTGVNASPGNGNASLTWTAPSSNGGATITSYTITPYIGSSAQATSTVTGNPAPTSAPVNSLSNGTTYTFTVTATNSAGSGAASAASNAVMPWNPAGAPSAPTNLSASAGNTQVTLNWTVPSLAGNSSITGYVVNWSGGPTSVAGGGATSTVITGLTDGTNYSFTVSAVNTQGTGPASNSASATPQAGPPGAPTLNSAQPGNAQVNLGWTAPSDNGGSAITGYTVSWTSSAGNGSTSAGGSPFAVNGLTNGVNYTFSVQAFNTIGTGAASNSLSATPATTPGAPTNLQASAGNQSVALTWGIPVSNGGSAITGYTVNWSGGPTAVSGGGTTTTTISGLNNGTNYSFTVSAVNGVGSGPASNSANATPQVSTNVVQNPGFESGLTSWTAGGVALPTASTTQKHGGNGAASLGTPGSSGHEPSGDSWLKQQIAVPTGGPHLTFWYRPQTTDSLPYDYQEAQIMNAAGNSTLAQVFKVCSNTQVWTQVTFDMTPYAGQTVTLYFNVHQDGYGDLTSMYLDDIAVQ